MKLLVEVKLAEYWQKLKEKYGEDGKDGKVMAIVQASELTIGERMKRRGVIEVTGEQLAWALKLPEGTEVVALVMDGGVPFQRMLVLVEHAALRETPEGGVYPRVQPLRRLSTCEHGYERVVGTWSERDMDSRAGGGA